MGGYPFLELVKLTPSFRPVWRNLPCPIRSIPLGTPFELKGPKPKKYKHAAQMGSQKSGDGVRSKMGWVPQRAPSEKHHTQKMRFPLIEVSCFARFLLAPSPGSAQGLPHVALKRLAGNPCFAFRLGATGGILCGASLARLGGWWAAFSASPASLGVLPIGFDLVAESCSGLVSGECWACCGLI